MGLIKKIAYFSIFILFLFLETGYSAWIGPDEVVESNWGKADNEFGKKWDYVEYKIPRLLAATPDGKIIITDRVNKRRVIYKSDGSLFKIIPLYVFENNKKVMNPNLSMYNYWNIRGYTLVGDIWMYTNKQYLLKSSVGETIKTTKIKPLELGVIKGLSVKCQDIEDPSLTVNNARTSKTRVKF